MAPSSAGISKVAWDHKNGSHQCFNPWGVSQLVPASPANALRLVSPLHLWSMCFSVWCFCAGFWVMLACTWALWEWIFCYLQFYSFPGHIFHWFSKSNILGVHFSCAGSRGWGAWCGAQISHSSGKRSIPLWSLLIVDHCGWDVHLFLVRPYLCLSSVSCCGPFTFCCGTLFIQFSGPFPRELFSM